jgi:hypothetical protein
MHEEPSAANTIKTLWIRRAGRQRKGLHLSGLPVGEGDGCMCVAAAAWALEHRADLAVADVNHIALVGYRAVNIESTEHV